MQDTWGAFHLPKADQTKIYRNKQMTLGGTPLKFICSICTNSIFIGCHLVSSLHHHMFFLSTSETTLYKLGANGKMPFHLTQEISGVSNQRFWLNRKHPFISEWATVLILKLNMLPFRWQKGGDLM